MRFLLGHFGSLFQADFPNMFLRARQDTSNEPAVEPSLADSKPAEATEAVEVPGTCGGAVKMAHNS